LNYDCFPTLDKLQWEHHDALAGTSGNIGRHRKTLNLDPVHFDLLQSCEMYSTNQLEKARSRTTLEALKRRITRVSLSRKQIYDSRSTAWTRIRDKQTPSQCWRNSPPKTSPTSAKTPILPCHQATLLNKTNPHQPSSVKPLSQQSSACLLLSLIKTLIRGSSR